MTIDRSKWPAGEWDTEPDREEFRAHGFPCLLRRNDHGAWCGYVGVHPGHRFHRISYDDAEVDVHGGLTYASSCNEHICHVPEPGESDDVWWLGFDCAHYRDILPGMLYLRNLIGHDLFCEGDAYRNIEYVRAETIRLAEQLA